MSLRPFKTLALALLVAASVGCAKPPPPEPPPEAPPPPPPPPKCESFSEKCQSKPDTRAKITSSDLVFTPAPGWVYAQQSSSTLAQSSETGPGIAFLGIDFDAKDAKKELASKDAAVTELSKQLGLTPLKRKVSWKKPDDNKTIGGMKVQLWQLEEAGVRGLRKGPLLVVAATAADGKAVVGLGFVPDDDKTAADVAIMKSIESLGKGQ
jgi:hypothetical protein